MGRRFNVFGKHFESMYSGSMVGAGAVVFAVMGYVIAKARPDAAVGTQVELNPKLMALILGEDEASVEAAIEFLCAPDAKSRSKEEGGRRLVRLGEYDYQVVNGAKYRAIGNEEKRRADNRFYQQVSRARNNVARSQPMKGETAAVKCENAGGNGDGIIDQANGEYPDEQ